ncbi:MAG: hypothetical protein R2744_02760 [Bacteroidales bacterium]
MRSLSAALDADSLEAMINLFDKVQETVEVTELKETERMRTLHWERLLRAFLSNRSGWEYSIT